MVQDWSSGFSWQWNSKAEVRWTTPWSAHNGRTALVIGFLNDNRGMCPVVGFDKTAWKVHGIVKFKNLSNAAIIMQNLLRAIRTHFFRLQSFRCLSCYCMGNLASLWCPIGTKTPISSYICTHFSLRVWSFRSLAFLPVLVLRHNDLIPTLWVKIFQRVRGGEQRSWNPK